MKFRDYISMVCEMTDKEAMGLEASESAPATSPFARFMGKNYRITLVHRNPKSIKEREKVLRDIGDSDEYFMSRLEKTDLSKYKEARIETYGRAEGKQYRGKYTIKEIIKL